MNPYFIIGAMIAIAASFSTGYWRGDTHGKAVIQQAWDQERAKQLAEYAENQRLAREKEQSMQHAADQLRQEKDREIRNVNARATALANSLRERAERPSTSSAVSKTTSNGQAPAGCTGKGLYKTDGEFLAGEAASADQLRIALKQCYAQYDSLTQ